MTASLDARQSLAEIDHALFKRFPLGGVDLAECNLMVGADETLIADADRGQV